MNLNIVLTFRLTKKPAGLLQIPQTQQEQWNEVLKSECGNHWNGDEEKERGTSCGSLLSSQFRGCHIKTSGLRHCEKYPSSPNSLLDERIPKEKSSMARQFYSSTFCLLEFGSLECPSYSETKSPVVFVCSILVGSLRFVKFIGMASGNFICLSPRAGKA